MLMSLIMVAMISIFLIKVFILERMRDKNHAIAENVDFIGKKDIKFSFTHLIAILVVS